MSPKDSGTESWIPSEEHVAIGPRPVTKDQDGAGFIHDFSAEWAFSGGTRVEDSGHWRDAF